jgi:adenylate cyclase
MPIEIERRFAVIGEPWTAAEPGENIIQGYLFTADDRSLRIRLAGGRAWLTLKLARSALNRLEIEHELPAEEGRELLAACGGIVVEKRRHRLEHAGWPWTIDVFGGASAGLVLAEIELPAEDTAFERPPWLGEELSSDGRYTSSSLARNPWRNPNSS